MSGLVSEMDHRVTEDKIRMFFIGFYFLKLKKEMKLYSIYDID